MSYYSCCIWKKQNKFSASIFRINLTRQVKTKKYFIFLIKSVETNVTIINLGRQKSFFIPHIKQKYLFQSCYWTIFGICKIGKPPI